MKKSLAILALAAVSLATTHAQVITQWNFNGTSSTTVPGGSSAPTPVTGSGTASLFGGATASFASGISNGGSTDPVTTSPDNFGWGTTTYGANTNAGNAGVQFNISTVGFTLGPVTSFDFSYDLRHSNTSSRYEQVQYTTNGTTWLDAGSFFDGNAGDTWFNNRLVSITDAAAFNNSAFAIRVTTSNGPGSVLAASSSTYASGGTWRFDMVTLQAIPEPSTWILIGLGVGFILMRVRSRKRGTVA